MFTHLHTHTEYSMLDGLSKVGPLVDRCVELGMNSLAITDHGGLYGAIDFYQTATAAGIKPIIGCELYVALRSRFDRTPEDKERYHLTALAKNEAGYRNLIKLVTKANLEGYYYKPRVDRDLLEQHSEGLILLTGCPSGEVPTFIAQGRTDEAKRAIAWYRERFPDYYLEVMQHEGVPELPAINAGLMDLHRETGTPLVATNDSHYTLPGEHELHDILLCIQTNTNIEDERRMRFDDTTYYLRTPQEMADLFADMPDAVANTSKIADMCDLRIDFSQLHLPHFDIPPGMTADEYLRKICEDSLREKIPDAGEREHQRLDYELDVIRRTKYATYFLVVWDIAQFVRRNNIELAVRGSAAASLVLYLVGVTDVNPLTYSLVFERFLNVERKQMPDIDMDFQDDRRDEVLRYVVEKYGSDHVAQIITFGTMGAKASVRDVGRALNMPYVEVDRVARLIPNRLKIKLDEALETSPELHEIYSADPSIKELVDKARGLEGIVRHSSTHAAGVVMSGERLDEIVPMQTSGRGGEDDGSSLPTTQYAMDPVEELGLLKIDFLGLINLTILAKTRELIRETRGIDVDHRALPLDDLKTYELLSRGETGGVFQLEGAGMTRYIKELKPAQFGEIASMIALYRPGPMDHIGAYIDAKHGRAPVEHLHDDFRDILEESYGVIVFQDQVLLITQKFAGYTLGEADSVRRAMGKKIPAVMAQEREKFIAGALAQGYEQELAERVFSLIEPFAGYAFNKAHSVCYALISYWTAYFKANYPQEYMACLLNAFSENLEKVASIVSECKRLKIPVLPPDILKSEPFYSIEVGEDGEFAIRAGLASIKNVGTGAIEEFVESRASLEGPAESIEQFCRAVDASGLNRKNLESLIKAGAFDGFGDRGAILDSIDRILSVAESEARLRSSDQTSMFDMFGETVPTPLTSIELPNVETPTTEKSRWEKELLGFAVSGNEEFDAMVAENDGKAIISVSDVTAELAGRRGVMINGQVSSSEERFTRAGKRFLIAKIALLGGSVDVFVWEDILAVSGELWEPGTLVSLVVAVRVRDDDRISLSCQRAEAYVRPDERESEDEEVTTTEPKPKASVPLPAPDLTLRSPSPNGGGSVPTGSKVREGVASYGAPKSPSPNGSENEQADASAPSANKQLVIRLREGDDADKDREILDDIKTALVEHQGEEDVTLEIAVQGRLITMDWPMLKVRINDDLERALKEYVGESGEVHVREKAASPT